MIPPFDSSRDRVGGVPGEGLDTVDCLDLSGAEDGEEELVGLEDSTVCPSEL